MGNKLEQLLNTLIQKGWKPFGKGGLNLRRLSGIHKGWLLLHEPSTRVADNYSLRDLVSKSSGLWQFVCKNCLLVKAPGHYWSWDSNYQGRGSEDRYPEYRLIESALKDESELEDFLLNSISLHE